MRQIRIGLIGCGNVAIGHATNLTRIPEAEIAALADVDESRVERLLGLVPAARGARVFADYREMLDEADLDAVEVLTPHALHYPQIVESLERGLHVLVEKPMVCSARQAYDVVKRASDRVVMVSYQRRLIGIYRMAKRLIGEGRIGELNFVHAFMAQGWLAISDGTWRQDPELGCGGELVDSGSHILDFILWATGLRPEEVSAYSQDLGRPVDVNTAAVVRFEGGAIGSLSIVGSAPPGFTQRYVFVGDRGMMTLDERGLRLREHGGEFTLEAARPPPSTTPDRAFVDVILGRRENPAPPICGLRVAELTDAIKESISRGGPVRVRHML